MQSGSCLLKQHSYSRTRPPFGNEVVAFVERWPYLRGFISMNPDVIGTTVSACPTV